MLWNRLSLRRKITALASGLVLLSLLVAGVLLIESVGQAVEDELGRRAMSVARAVAQVDTVKQRLEGGDPEAIIQAVAERMRLATGVEYIVILDMSRIRRSHPLQDRIGTPFEGGDEGPAFAEQQYVSRAEGVLGRSVRAFVPIMSTSGADQVGVVVVGILVPGLVELLSDHKTPLLIALFSALLVGLMGAWLLAHNIKQQMFDLEPAEIARQLEERVAALSAITEGLIAIDGESRITVMTDEAKRIVGLPPDAEVVGRPVLEVIPYSRLPEVLKTGQWVRNQQMLFGRTVILTNRLPIKVKGRIVGALATFRDRTELNKLAEELTGVTAFVEALRAQNHENLNKLHTIAGMIQMKKYTQVLDYIFSLTEQQQGIARFVSRNIRDHRISGLLLGKMTRARELGITLQIDPDSRVDEVAPPLHVSDLVVVMGNLIENAMDAVKETALEERRITCLVRSDKNGLEIRVEDNGCGLPPGVPTEQIFEQGFTTKGAEGRGIGLALVKQIVDLAGGQIGVESVPGHTVFRIWLPGGGVHAAD